MPNAQAVWDFQSSNGQRYVQRFSVEVFPVAVAPMPAEFLTMVGSDDNDCIFPIGGPSEKVKEPTHLPVKVSDAVVVSRNQRRPLIGIWWRSVAGC